MDKCEQEIRRISDDAFKNHRVVELSRNGVFRSWRCCQPGSGMYAFNITTIPGRIFVTGDIGDLIVERVYDMLPFCRRSLRDTSYFASKVPHAIPTREFSANVLGDWINEQLADPELEDHHREPLLDAQLLIDNGEVTEGKAYEIIYPFYDDPPRWQVWNSNFLWCRDAIRWFLAHHDEPEIRKPESVVVHL